MKRTLWLIVWGLSLPFNAFGQAPIDANQLKSLVANKAIVLDVRTQEEWLTGHLPMAKLLPLNLLTADTAARLIPSKATPVVVYCRSGNRSGQAAQILARLGYTQVRDFGAISRWPDKLSTGP